MVERVEENPCAKNMARAGLKGFKSSKLKGEF